MAVKDNLGGGLKINGLSDIITVNCKDMSIKKNDLLNDIAATVDGKGRYQSYSYFGLTLFIGQGGLPNSMIKIDSNLYLIHGSYYSNSSSSTKFTERYTLVSYDLDSNTIVTKSDTGPYTFTAANGYDNGFYPLLVCCGNTVLNLRTGINKSTNKPCLIISPVKIVNNAIDETMPAILYDFGKFHIKYSTVSTEQPYLYDNNYDDNSYVSDCTITNYFVLSDNTILMQFTAKFLSSTNTKISVVEQIYMRFKYNNDNTITVIDEFTSGFGGASYVNNATNNISSYSGYSIKLHKESDKLVLLHRPSGIGDRIFADLYAINKDKPLTKISRLIIPTKYNSECVADVAKHTNYGMHSALNNFYQTMETDCIINNEYATILSRGYLSPTVKNKANSSYGSEREVWTLNLTEQLLTASQKIRKFNTYNIYNINNENFELIFSNGITYKAGTSYTDEILPVECDCSGVTAKYVNRIVKTDTSDISYYKYYKLLTGSTTSLVVSVNDIPYIVRLNSNYISEKGYYLSPNSLIVINDKDNRYPGHMVSDIVYDVINKTGIERNTNTLEYPLGNSVNPSDYSQSTYRYMLVTAMSRINQYEPVYNNYDRTVYDMTTNFIHKFRRNGYGDHSINESTSSVYDFVGFVQIKNPMSVVKSCGPLDKGTVSRGQNLAIAVSDPDPDTNTVKVRYF